MPATRLSEIKNLSELVERALAAVHADVGGAAVLPRATEDHGDVLVYAIFNLGPATGHRYKRPDGQWDYDAFEQCVIEWHIAAPRLVAQIEGPALAAVYTVLAREVARVHLAMDPARWDALNARLAHHHLTKLVPQGHVLGFDGDRREDTAVVRYGCTAWVKPDAWPVDLTAYTGSL